MINHKYTTSILNWIARPTAALLSGLSFCFASSAIGQELSFGFSTEIFNEFTFVDEKTVLFLSDSFVAAGSHKNKRVTGDGRNIIPFQVGYSQDLEQGRFHLGFAYRSFDVEGKSDPNGVRMNISAGFKNTLGIQLINLTPGQTSFTSNSYDVRRQRSTFGLYGGLESDEFIIAQGPSGGLGATLYGNAAYTNDSQTISIENTSCSAGVTTKLFNIEAGYTLGYTLNMANGMSIRPYQSVEMADFTTRQREGTVKVDGTLCSKRTIPADSEFFDRYQEIDIGTGNTSQGVEFTFYDGLAGLEVTSSSPMGITRDLNIIFSMSF